MKSSLLVVGIFGAALAVAGRLNAQQAATDPTPLQRCNQFGACRSPGRAGRASRSLYPERPRLMRPKSCAVSDFRADEASHG